MSDSENEIVSRGPRARATQSSPRTAAVEVKPKKTKKLEKKKTQKGKKEKYISSDEELIQKKKEKKTLSSSKGSSKSRSDRSTQKSTKQTTTWVSHCKDYAAKHGCSYGEAMKLAKPSWEKLKGKK